VVVNGKGILALVNIAKITFLKWGWGRGSGIYLRNTVSPPNPSYFGGKILNFGVTYRII
jgi:hypothetical protein